MHKLIIIGNGFDLAHGLKTRYNDFILWYLNKCINSMKSDYEDDLIRVISKSPIAIKNFESLEEFFKFIKHYNISIEYKNDFFSKIISKTKDFSWVDIESEYYRSLLSLYKDLEINYASNFHTENNEKLNKLNFCFEQIKISLIEYLSTIKIKDVPKINEIEEHFKSIFPNNNNKNYERVLILNFNYTSTLDIYSDIVNNNNNNPIINIHGNLNDSKKIIFGYGDEADIYYSKIERLNNNEYLKYFKSFGYSLDYNYTHLSGFLSNILSSEVFEVHIMGHSCGLSDRVLLNSIFEHPQCYKIKIFYWQKNTTENDYFEKTQEISRHFTPLGKNKMRNIIVPFPKCQPLVKFKI